MFIDITQLVAVLTVLDFAPTNKWENLCLDLGLYKNTLATIKADSNRDSEKCLEECLAQWLRRVDGVDERGLPSWHTLADAVEKFDRNIAASIRKECKYINGYLNALYFIYRFYYIKYNTVYYHYCC